MTLYESLVKNIGIGWNAFWPRFQDILKQNGYKSTVCMERSQGDSRSKSDPEWVEILLDKLGSGTKSKEVRDFLKIYSNNIKRGKNKERFFIDKFQLEIELGEDLISPRPSVVIFTTNKDSYKKMQEMHKNLGGR